MAATTSLRTSQAVTRAPFEANTHASGKPILPAPITVTFIAAFPGTTPAFAGDLHPNRRAVRTRASDVLAQCPARVPGPRHAPSSRVRCGRLARAPPRVAPAAAWSRLHADYRR